MTVTVVLTVESLKELPEIVTGELERQDGNGLIVRSDADGIDRFYPWDRIQYSTAPALVPVASGQENDR